MDALLMCGGRGTRLDAGVEKPLVGLGGRPMIDRVSDALAESRVETTYAVVSPHAPATRAHAENAEIPTISTPGAGYVADLERAIEAVDLPVLTVAADLPLLVGDLVDEVLAAHAEGTARSLVVCVPAELKRRLGASLDETWTTDGREVAATGVNVVDGGSDAVHLSYDARLAVNVNRSADVELAEALL